MQEYKQSKTRENDASEENGPIFEYDLSLVETFNTTLDNLDKSLFPIDVIEIKGMFLFLNQHLHRGAKKSHINQNMVDLLGF